MQSYLLAFLQPILVSLQITIAKVSLVNNNIPDEAVVFARLFYGVPLFCLALVVGIENVTIQPQFWLVMAIMIIAEIPSQWYFHQAIKEKQTALVLPLASLLSLLVIITSPIVTYIFDKKIPELTTTKIIGISIIVIVNYTLNSNWDNFKRGLFFEPFKKIVTEKSSKYMLITILLWTITTHLQPVAVANSGLFTMTVIYLSGAALGTVIVSYFKSPQDHRMKPQTVINLKYFWRLAPIGFIAGFASLCQYQALKELHPSLLLGIKSTGILWAAVADYFVFNQKLPKVKLFLIFGVVIGTIFMCL